MPAYEACACGAVCAHSMCTLRCERHEINQPRMPHVCMHSWLSVSESSCCVATIQYDHAMFTGLLWAVLDVHAELAYCHAVTPHPCNASDIGMHMCIQTVCCLVGRAYFDSMVGKHA